METSVTSDSVYIETKYNRHLSFSLYVRMACLMLTDILFSVHRYCHVLELLLLIRTYVRVALVGCILQTCKFPLISEPALICALRKSEICRCQDNSFSMSPKRSISARIKSFIHSGAEGGCKQESSLPPPSIHHPTENTESGMQPESESK